MTTPAHSRPALAAWPALATFAALVVLPPTVASQPADGTVARHCRTAAACRADADRLRVQAARDATSPLAREQDLFYWFGRINMASTVANVELGIIPADLAGPIARGVAHSIDQAARPGGKRPNDVLQTEKIITDAAGPDATLIHTGRSRQDIHSTLTMAQLRTELLDYADALNGLRAQLQGMAEQHAETFVPAYTNGVQAQPISLAYYLLAFADSFERDAERLRQAWPRVDRSTLGAAVLANSSWPLDRRRLADLLGFGGIQLNGYDATQIAPEDLGLEAAQIAGSNALRIGSLMQDLHVQYHQTRPWMLLAPGRTYTSSAMPQKANPGVIQNTRTLASDVVASVQQVVMRAHNVTPGMIDYKYSWNWPRRCSTSTAFRSAWGTISPARWCCTRDSTVSCPRTFRTTRRSGCTPRRCSTSSCPTDDCRSTKPRSAAPCRRPTWCARGSAREDRSRPRRAACWLNRARCWPPTAPGWRRDAMRWPQPKRP